MMCFRDTTFCSSPNCKNLCGRQFTDIDRRAAEKWWGGPDAPICFGEFCDEKGELIERKAP